MKALRYSAIAAGTAVTAYGVVGLLTEPQIRHPGLVATWLLGGVALHDAVLAPAVFLLCWWSARHTGPRARRVLAAVLLVAGAVLLLAAPVLLHGRVAIR